ncbi:HAMP domain-containing sensor histidine kinase [Micromonospora sp. WMMC241]|uniref:sensor histidine kinase n=1 Tax=Micromonospora sp. WMMC241 TaxID=3015159 RepID=UPI0022B73065|nr:HAMP domain-containing sensor histidine kinase [Micromonospora sp. WMMC241]MCZ7437085.1 HAMP domain-containing sensor histidine kinase [Micromonospora sp. WMMC241]
MTRLPLRRSLLTGMVALTTVALLVAGVVSAAGLRAYLLQRTDDQLRAGAALATQRVGVLLREPGGAARAVVAPSDYLVEIRHPDGTLTRLGGSPPATPLLERAPAPPSGGGPGPATTLDRGAWRAVTVRTGGAVVLIALPLAPVRETVRRLVLVELAGGLTVLVLLAGFARVLLARGLRPLDRITDSATAIAGGDLGRRVPVEGSDRTEVGRLTRAVDGMLARLQSAIAARARSEARLRTFVADASHELRTPLTSIRGYLHLLSRDMVEPARRPEVLRRGAEEATRMSRILDDLLYLARLDAEPRLDREDVDLAEVARESVADALAVQPGRPLRVVAPDAAPVRGDADALRQVLGNLLANVRAHTPAGTPAVVEVHARGDRVEVAVRDSGPGMSPELAARAFERFSHGADGGSGLGLAIVAEILAAHDGELGLDTAEGTGVTVWFRLPRARS